MADITIRFDGDLVTNNRVSLRTLGRTLYHLQKSFDRAYLENRHGKLWKRAAMHTSYYEECEILILDAYEGSFKLDLGRLGAAVPDVLERVKSALLGVTEEMQNEGVDRLNRLKQTHSTRIAQLNTGIYSPVPFADAANKLSDIHTRKYGDRAILRELDQILAILRSPTSGESHFEIELGGPKRVKFSFDRRDADRFSTIIKERTLSPPIIFSGKLEGMSRKNRSGQILNVDTNKTCNIYFFNEDSFREVVDNFREDDSFQFIGSSLVEYGAFDPQAGDIYYLSKYPIEDGDE